MINKNRFFDRYSLKSIVFIFLTLCSFSLVEAANPDSGKELFKANCATCHNKNMKDKLTGPPLNKMLEHWSAYPKEDLYKWIKNSQSMIAAGHPRAVEMWNEYKPTVMTAFPTLTNENIDDIIAYVDGVSSGTYGVPPPGSGVAAVGDTAVKKPSNVLYFVIFGVLAILALVLTSLVNNLGNLEKAKDGQPVEKKTLLQSLSSKSLIGLVLFALIVLGSYTTVNNAINLGRQQNYAPEQPIKFSHVTHAGLNKIDCKFCHDGARRSKHSGIPSTNTCMSCHQAIKNGSQYGTQEITKIYASIGFNPNTDKYIENYENLSQNDVAAIFKKWIGDQYMAANNAKMDDNTKSIVNEQWDHIVKSLTNNEKKKVQGPIEWIRVHNLPDHVYFSHEQHVTVGKVDCENCHGKVAEMETLRQYSPLSMGWCINCHRETEVKFADNPYYESYVRYHQEIKEGKRDKVTVADIGGLECQKCHY